MTEKIVRFNSDTKHRKQWFTGLSFSHPAKMALPLQLWIIGKYTKAGETILDPMAGSGTLLVACSMGRHVIAVDLEQKFVDMMAGYDCDGQVKGYEDIEISSAQESGWILDIIDDPWMASPFATREDALAFKNANWADAEKWEIYYQEAEPAVFEKQPVPSRCGKRGEHNPHRVVGNWEKIQERGYQMGHSMGTATILQGDARNLTGILVDKIITSPPYEQSLDRWAGDNRNKLMEDKGLHAMPKVDKIITSPPYAEAQIGDNRKVFNPTIQGIGRGDGKKRGGSLVAYHESTQGSNNNIANLPYGQMDLLCSPQVDKIITSPPYECSVSVSNSKPEERAERLKKAGYKPEEFLGGKARVCGIDWQYSNGQKNIGNLKSDSYLSAMFQVYQQCHAVLRPDGLMILVTKNFIRNKQQVRLDLDTIRLCEQAGFTFQDRWYRELASQSFWRTIYHQRYPSVPPIKYEDILIFLKG